MIGSVGPLGAAPRTTAVVLSPSDGSSTLLQNNTEGLQELACGGLIYCLGVLFFKSDGIIPFAHAIWHVFVALAAAVHYYAIWKYLYRPANGDALRQS